MPEMKVGDPPGVLRAVERAHGEVVPVAGTLNWALSPDDGSLAELVLPAPGESPDTVKLVAKAPGSVVATVADPQFSLSGSLTIEILPAPAPIPDSIEIVFEPGT